MSGFEKIIDRIYQAAADPGHWFAVSVATVRTQTKSVFQKTSAHRQAELAALLAGLPKIPLR